MFKIGDVVYDSEWNKDVHGTITKIYGNGAASNRLDKHRFGICGGEENGASSKLVLVKRNRELALTTSTTIPPQTHKLQAIYDGLGATEYNLHVEKVEKGVVIGLDSGVYTKSNVQDLIEILKQIEGVM